MPTGYVIVDARTVRAPGGQEHDVLEAINALPWREQLCPLMRHEYSIWGQGPEWAWNVLSSMLLAKNPDSFGAYFRGYSSANRYWDAPDGLRYWRGKFEIDRGQPDGAGLRRVAEGAKPAKDWDGPPHAPNGIGLYDRDEKGRWWPTGAALASGYLPCSACEQTNKKPAIVASPKYPHRIATFIAAAAAELGRPLDREELSRLLRWYPSRAAGPVAGVTAVEQGPTAASLTRQSPQGSNVPDMSSIKDSKAQLVRKLLELRAREAPLGSTAYRGVLSQKAIADVAGIRVQDVTRAALDMDREMEAAKAKKAE